MYQQFPISNLQNQIQGYPMYYNQIPYTPPPYPPVQQYPPNIAAQLPPNIVPIYQAQQPQVYPYSYNQMPIFSPYVYPQQIEPTQDEYQDDYQADYQDPDYQQDEYQEEPQDDYTYQEPEYDEQMYEYKYLNPEEYLSTYNDIPDEELTHDQRLQKQMNLYLIKNKHLIEEKFNEQKNKLKQLKEMENQKALELEQLEQLRNQEEEERKQIEQERLRREEEQRLLEEQRRYEEIQNQSLQQSVIDANEKYPEIIEEQPIEEQPIEEQHIEEQSIEEQPIEEQSIEEQPNEETSEEQPNEETSEEQPNEEIPEEIPEEQYEEHPNEDISEEHPDETSEETKENLEMDMNHNRELKEQELRYEKELKEKEIELERIKKMNEDRIKHLEQIEKDRAYKEEQLENRLKSLEEQKQPIEQPIEEPIEQPIEEPKPIEQVEDKKEAIQESLQVDIYRETELDGIPLNSNMSSAELDYYLFNYLLSLPDETLKSLNRYDNCNKLMKSIANKIPKTKEISLYMSRFYIRIYQVYVLIDNLFDPKIEYKSDRSLLYFNKPENIPELKALFFDIYDPVKKEYNQMSPNMESMYTKMLHQFTQSFTSYGYDLSTVKEYADIDVKKIDYIPRTSDNIVDIYANALKALHLIIKEYQNDLNSLLLKMFKKEDNVFIINPELTHKMLEEEIIPTVFKHVGYISDKINECFVNIENIFEVIVEQQTLITTFHRIQYIEKKLFELY